MGFTLNHYDLCVVNKEINGSTRTIVFYVDDNKVSHKDPKVVQNILSILKEYFGDLTVNNSREFDFLGMNIKIREDKKIEMEMKSQIEEAIEWLGEDIDSTPKSPANRNLFSEKEGAEELIGEKSDTFHSIVAKLLYISKRARPDIEVAVAYLCTRVSKSTDDDWKKLKRVLGFLKGTIDDIRVIGVNSMKDLYTWVDASYAVHEDMRSQTGGVMSFGHGILHHKSFVQKLNTKSSTEAELVGTSEYVPYNIWMKKILHEQGYDIKDKVHLGTR